MWINKYAFRQWVDQVRRLEDHVKAQHQTIEAQRVELAMARAATDDLVASRLALAQKASAQAAYANVFRTQLNAANSQVAALLTKHVPGLDIAVPLIERTDLPTADPFEDVGDAAAQHMGLADALPVVGVGTPHREPVIPGVPES